MGRHLSFNDFGVIPGQHRWTRGISFKAAKAGDLLTKPSKRKIHGLPPARRTEEQNLAMLFNGPLSMEKFNPIDVAGMLDKGLVVEKKSYGKSMIGLPGCVFPVGPTSSRKGVGVQGVSDKMGAYFQRKQERLRMKRDAKNAANRRAPNGRS